MEDLVSVIMPAYNASKYIGESIKSVQAQTYSNWELIIVDDGSTDNTQSAIEAYTRQDSRIKYIYQPNGRQGKARNNGIAQSSGRYVAFLDSDDLWLSEKLAIQVSALQKRKVDLVFSDSYIFYDLFDASSSTDVMHTERRDFAGDEGVQAFLEMNRVPILTVLCTRTALEHVKGFSEQPSIQNAEDYHLWLKLLLSGYTLSGLDCILAAYRKHTSSVSDANSLNPLQMVEGKLELCRSYPEKEDIILPSVRRGMLLSLYYVSQWHSSDFYPIVDRYLHIIKRDEFRPLFRGFKQIGAHKLAVRSIYFIFNYL